MISVSWPPLYEQLPLTPVSTIMNCAAQSQRGGAHIVQLQPPNLHPLKLTPLSIFSQQEKLITTCDHGEVKGGCAPEHQSLGSGEPGARTQLESSPDEPAAGVHCRMRRQLYISFFQAAGLFSVLSVTGLV